MSLKHHKRIRAEKLRNRDKPVMGFDKRPAPLAWVERRSKYTPHIGAKEQTRATRCRMDYLHGSPRVHNDNERSAPILCQLSRG
jgi:hypothetical protein